MEKKRETLGYEEKMRSHDKSIGHGNSLFLLFVFR